MYIKKMKKKIERESKTYLWLKKCVTLTLVVCIYIRVCIQKLYTSNWLNIRPLSTSTIDKIKKSSIMANS